MDRLKNFTGYFLPLLLGIYFFTLNTIGEKLQYIPGDLGDARFNIYLLEHNYQFFLGNIKDYWNAGFMFPEKDVITYSDNLLGSAPIYSVFRVLGCDRELAFQFWYLALSILSFSSAYLLFKYLFKNYFVAGLCAFIFTFSIALYSQINHAQTFPRFAIPLIFLFGIKFSKEWDPKYFLLTLILIVYEIYCGIYLGFLVVIPISLLLFTSLLFNFQNAKAVITKWKWWLQIISLILLSITLLLPIALPYIERSETSGSRAFEEVLNSIPTIKSYLFSYRGSLLWDNLAEVGIELPAWWDQTLFPGGVVLISFIVGSFLILRKWNVQSINNKLIFASFFVCFLTFLRFDDFTVYKLIFLIPGFDSMRSISRFINVELIFFAWFVGFLSETLFTHFKKYQLQLFFILLFVIVSDNYVFADKIITISKIEMQNRIEQLNWKLINSKKGDVVVYIPNDSTENSIHYHLDAMLASQQYNLRTVNGYTATCPGAFGPFWRGPNYMNFQIWTKASNLDTLNQKFLIVK